MIKIMASDIDTVTHTDDKRTAVMIITKDFDRSIMIKNSILWHQGFTNDILTRYIDFLKNEKTDSLQTRDLDDIITDIKQIEAGDFFEEE